MKKRRTLRVRARRLWQKSILFWKRLEPRHRMAAIVSTSTVVLACVAIPLLISASGTPVRAVAAPDAMETRPVRAQAPRVGVPFAKKAAEATPTPDPTLKAGMKGKEVAALQARLMDLDYLDIDESTGLYGPATKYAVQMFQRQHDLVQDGICGPRTLKLIYAKKAKHYTLLQGTRGTDVDSLQDRLKELGYLGKNTGYYGTDTIEAVKAFQKRNKLKIDGKTGAETLELIYSPKARESVKMVRQKQRTGTIDSFIKSAEKQLGKPYVWGAAGVNSFDCSGLVTYCLREAGSTTGRYNAAGFSQMDKWERVDTVDQLKRGDLIFFYNNSRSKIGHVGIIISDTEMIDASSANGKVVQRSYKTDYWRGVFYCGRRPW